MEYDGFMLAWAAGWLGAIVMLIWFQRRKQSVAEQHESVYRRLWVRCPENIGRAEVEQYMHQLGARAVSLVTPLAALSRDLSLVG